MGPTIWRNVSWWTPADWSLFMAYRMLSCNSGCEDGSASLSSRLIRLPHCDGSMAGQWPVSGVVTCLPALCRLQSVSYSRVTLGAATAPYPHLLSKSTRVGRILSVLEISHLALDDSCDSFPFSGLTANDFTMRKRRLFASISPTTLLHASPKRMCQYGWFWIHGSQPICIALQN